MVLSTEHDAAIAILQAQLDLKKKKALIEKSKALIVGHDLSTANDKLNKLQADVRKYWKDYDDLACQVCDSKSERVRIMKELMSNKKKVVEQLELTLAHKK
jgi:uncharacterized membrane-anchored protein YhcB (DUF1043 family)